MTFGIIDTTYIDWPSNIDATYLQGLTLRSGVELTRVATMLDRVLGQINGGLDPLLSSLMAPSTTNITSFTGPTSRMTAQRRSEYTLPRPQQVERLAHALPINEYEMALGWTEDGLQEMSLDLIQMQLDAFGLGWEALHRAEVLGRFFSDAEVPVDRGTAMTSPGFAGSGTGGNAFVGLYPDNTPLPGGYTHYYRDTAANIVPLLKSIRDRLRKWHLPPYDLIGSQTVIDTITALSAPDFVSAGSVLVRVGDTVSEALVDPNEYVGVAIGDIRVYRPIVDFTSANFAVFKSYGALNPRNPLIWRYDPMRGQGAIARSRTLFPLAEVVGIQKFGIGVSDRTGAALGLLAASGPYVAPTFLY